MLLNVMQVSKILNISEPTAYKRIVELRKELEEKGYRTERARIPKDYLLKRYGLNEDDER